MSRSLRQLNFLVLATCLGLASAVAAQTPSAATGTTVAPGGKGYSFKCSDTPSLQDWSAELDAIKPLPPIGAPLRVLLPVPTADKKSLCIGAMYEARVEAMRRSGLFSSVDVVEDSAPGIRPDTRQEGYWVWVDTYAMVVSYGDGRRSNLFFNALPLNGWVAALPKFLQSVKDAGDKNSPSVSLVGIGSNSYYGYRGREYISYSDVRAALMAFAKSFADQTQPVKRSGHRALVLFPPEETQIDDGVRRFHLGSMDPTGSFSKIAGSATYSVQTGEANAIRKSGLFQETTVEERNVSGVPEGDYDAVIWTTVADYGKWHVQLKDRQPVLLTPQNYENGAQWIAALTKAFDIAAMQAP